MLKKESQLQDIDLRKSVDVANPLPNRDFPFHLNSQTVSSDRAKPVKKTEAVSREVLDGYKTLVVGIMLMRARVGVLVGCVFFMGFSFVDQRIFPPEPQAALMTMRIILCSLLLVLYSLSFLRAFQRHVIWLIDFGIILATAGMCFVVYKTEGASGRYYEGINQQMLVWLLANSFYYKHHIFVGFVMVLMYTVACLTNSAYWNPTKYIYSTSLLAITATFVVILAKFYAREFFYGYVRNEALKESERKTEEMNKKLAVMYREADQMSKIDDLTKIYNRRYFLEVLTQKIRKCREEGTFFYLIIFDIDHFKRINDTYGHSVGDEVIRTVARTVSENLRAHSYIGRYGGDEFMIIIDKAERDTFFKRIRTVKEAISNAKLAHGNIKLGSGGNDLKISVSVGAVKVDPVKYDKISSVIEIADKALLSVKQTKRGEINLVD